MNEEIQDIAEKINRLVEIEVEDRLSTETSWKMEYDILVSLITELKDEGERLVDGYKREGLTFNSLEAEGYLRCALTLYNRLEWYREKLEESE